MSTKAKHATPDPLSAALKAVRGVESAAATAAVPTEAIDNFPRERRSRSPAANTATRPMFDRVSSNACRAPSQKPTSCTATRTYALCDMYCRWRVATSRQQRRQQWATPLSSGLPEPSVCAWCKQCSSRKRSGRPGSTSSEPMAREPAEYRRVRHDARSSAPPPPPSAREGAPKYHRTISPAVAQKAQWKRTSIAHSEPKLCSRNSHCSRSSA
mmetsp:Transcript_42186/g.136018  ORF Transcript_42186/g.136018 Transcript_42186/m.136018 type:complete len:213 (-) Transcript_42186:960-1598(-)